MNEKNIFLWIGIAVVTLAVVWGGVDILASHDGTTSTATTPTTIADPLSLPGISTSTAPWPVELENLKARLAADSLPALSSEGTVLHIHQHLDLFVHGAQVPVPAGIGIDEGAGFISPIHVHDATGILHVESPFVASFTLGQFFDIWGVRFTNLCLGGYCTDESNQLRVYVNGALYQGDPRMLVLAAHQEIAIAFGTASETPSTIPASFEFPAGD